MININTLNKLESMRIGPDIDKLENYVALVNYSKIMGNPILDNNNYNKITELLKQLKNDSEVLRYTWNMEKAEIDEYDRYLVKNGGILENKLSGISSKSLNEIISNMKNIEDILALSIPDGIEIRLIYRRGILSGAFTYNNNTKGKNIRKHLLKLVTQYIEDLREIDLVEFRAVISVNEECKNIKSYERLEKIVKFLVEEPSDANIDKFEVRVYNMYTDEIDIDTYWDKLNLAYSLGLNTVEHALIREIEGDSLIEALHELERHFIDNTVYKPSEILVVFNDKPDKIVAGIDLKHGYDTIYQSDVIDIKWVHKYNGLVPKLIIKPCAVKDGHISSIILKNAGQLINNNICKKSKVYFRVDFTGNILLCDAIGIELN